MCYFLFICNYLWNLQAISEWKLKKNQCGGVSGKLLKYFYANYNFSHFNKFGWWKYAY